MAAEDETILEEENIEEEMMPPSKLMEEKKYPVIGFALSLVAGVLILIGGIVVFALGPFIASVVPWTEIPADAQFGVGLAGGVLVAMGSIGISFGIIIILMDIFLVKAGKTIPGGVVIIVLSLISLISLGGFFIGFILGIIGGILMLANK